MRAAVGSHADEDSNIRHLPPPNPSQNPPSATAGSGPPSSSHTSQSVRPPRSSRRPGGAVGLGRLLNLNSPAPGGLAALGGLTARSMHETAPADDRMHADRDRGDSRSAAVDKMFLTSPLDEMKMRHHGGAGSPAPSSSSSSSSSAYDSSMIEVQSFGSWSQRRGGDEKRILVDTQLEHMAAAGDSPIGGLGKQESPTSSARQRSGVAVSSFFSDKNVNEHFHDSDDDDRCDEDGDGKSKRSSAEGGTGRGRDRWSSRTSFILAAIGSAIGIGNLWRFPYLAYRYGGGVFFVPYFLALFLIGIPILQLEFSLGQFFQGGSFIAFGSLSQRSRGLGIAAPFAAFVVVVYYSSILSWSLVYFVNSFRNPLPWANDDIELAQTCSTLAEEAQCIALSVCNWTEGICKALTVDIKAAEFFNDIINVRGPTDLTMKGSGYVVAGLAVTWIAIFVCIFRGAKFLGKVLYVTLIGPIILLLVMLVRAVTLDGAIDGIRRYILIWDWQQLIKEPSMWSAAVGQIFFSIGVCYGIMTTYASFNRKQQNVVQDAIIVAASNSLFSVVAGIVVFAVAGYLAFVSGSSLEDLNTGGVGLVFLTFPTALSQMSGYSAQIFSALFFILFFLLGIDSAFAMVEAGVTFLADSKPFRDTRKLWIVSAVCVLGFAVALPFTSSVGTHLIDAIDFYAASIASVFIGFCETTTAGWLQGAGQQAAHVGLPSVVLAAVGYFGAIILGASLGFGVKTEVAWLNGHSAGVLLGPLFGLLFFLVGTALAVALIPCHRRKHRKASSSLFLSPSRNGAYTAADGSGAEDPNTTCTERKRESSAAELTFKGKLWWLFLGNIEMLRQELNSVIAAEDKCCCCHCPAIFSKLNFVWSLLVKFLIPGFLVVLLTETFSSSEMFHYSDLPVGYQVAGSVLAFSCIMMILIGVTAPSVYLPLVVDSDDVHDVDFNRQAHDRKMALNFPADQVLTTDPPDDDDIDNVDNADSNYFASPHPNGPIDRDRGHRAVVNDEAGEAAKSAAALALSSSSSSSKHHHLQAPSPTAGGQHQQLKRRQQFPPPDSSPFPVPSPRPESAAPGTSLTSAEAIATGAVIVLQDAAHGAAQHGPRRPSTWSSGRGAASRRNHSGAEALQSGNDRKT